MGLPSGRKWAVANIDVSTPSGFQEVNGVVSPFKYMCSFCSWGNTDMRNPSSLSSFSPYNWGGINGQEPWYEGQVYGSTPGAALTQNAGPANDAARINLGAQWRLPTSDEFKELFDNSDFIDAEGNLVTGTNKIITMKGVSGVRIRSKINGNDLFFPTSGYGHGPTWGNSGTRGYYWSSTWFSDRNARGFHFNADSVDPQASGIRYSGYSVRPVL